MYKAHMAEILHNNPELKTDLKNALKPGYFAHIYSADIHVSTMVPIVIGDDTDKDIIRKLGEYMKKYVR